MKNIIILSDIHANLTALNRVLDCADLNAMDHVVLLGDIIDYGPRSNEVIERLLELDENKILVNIKHTRSGLSERSFAYIRNMNTKGFQEFDISGKHCLAVHGSLEDVFWKSIDFACLDEAYAEYDYVFSGHSHIPFCAEKFYDGNSAEYRNKKKTVFLNPGSVGQPRNHNPNANFAVLDIESGTVTMHSLEYDYKAEMKLFSDQVDRFYKERLAKGI